MRFESFYEFKKKPREDWFFFRPWSPFVCMFDGCSRPYCMPKKPPVLFDKGLTGGQMVVDVLEQYFAQADPGYSLKNVMLAGSAIVANNQLHYGGSSLDHAGTLANANFSCLKVDEERRSAEVIWGADVFTIWKKTDGTVGIVGGDNLACELMREKTYANIIARAGDDEEKVREAKEHYFLEVSPKIKDKQENKLFPTLNGQLNVERHWNQLQLTDLELVVLLTDGAWIPMEMWEEESYNVAEELISSLSNNGLSSTILRLKEKYRGGISEKREPNPEATALAMWL